MPEERLSETRHGDAPLSAAYAPDATAAIPEADVDDELIARTFTIHRSLEEVRAFFGEPRNLLRVVGEDEALPWTALSLQLPDGATQPVPMPSGLADASAEERAARLLLRPAPADRGTEVTVVLAVEERGLLRRATQKFTGSDPRLQSRRVLRRLKQLLETGEIATTTPGAAAPRA